MLDSNLIACLIMRGALVDLARRDDKAMNQGSDQRAATLQGNARLSLRFPPTIRPIRSPDKQLLNEIISVYRFNETRE